MNKVAKQALNSLPRNRVGLLISSQISLSGSCLVEIRFLNGFVIQVCSYPFQCLAKLLAGLLVISNDIGDVPA